MRAFLGIRHPPGLRFRVGPVLDKLLDSVVLVEKLARVLLAPPELQTMHHLGRLDGGREVCEHRDLLVLVPENEDRPQGARAADARRLLDDVVHLPRALEGELAPLEAVAGHEAAGFAAFQVGDKADALGREEAKGIRGKAPAIKDQRKGARPVDLANLPTIAGRRGRANH